MRDSARFPSRGRHGSRSFEVDQFNFFPPLSQAQLHPRLLSSRSLLLQVTLGPVSRATRGAGLRVPAQRCLTLCLCSRLAPLQAAAPSRGGEPPPSCSLPPQQDGGKNRKGKSEKKLMDRDTDRLAREGNSLGKYSKNHTVGEVGRGLWRSLGPTPCSSRATYSQLPRTTSGWHLNISKVGDSNLPGQPVPGLGHPHGEKAFPDVQREPPVLQFEPTASGPATGHQCNEPGSVLSAVSLQVLAHVGQMPP